MSEHAFQWLPIATEDLSHANWCALGLMKLTAKHYTAVECNTCKGIISVKDETLVQALLVQKNPSTNAVHALSMVYQCLACGIASGQNLNST